MGFRICCFATYPKFQTNVGSIIANKAYILNNVNCKQQQQISHNHENKKKTNNE